MTKSLEEQHCQACEGGVDPLNVEQISALKSQVPDWKVSEDNKSISRKFTFKNFYKTMAFVNAIAYIANVENHHPDLQVGYSYCTVTFTTHAIKGLSPNDFICARKVDLLLSV